MNDQLHWFPEMPRCQGCQFLSSEINVYSDGKFNSDSKVYSNSEVRNECKVNSNHIA